MQEVEAVKTREEIALVEVLLRKHFSDLYGDIWKVGVNLALRISDLLAIRYADIDLIKNEYSLVEGKTGKNRVVGLNTPVVTIITRRHKENPNDVYLFQTHSNRTASLAPRPVSRITVSKRFKEVGDMRSVNLKLGTHSMRKTRGWAMHVDGVAIERIAKVLNHTSTTTTMRYLGITQADVLKTYHDYEL
jgi:integrase